MHRQPQSHHLGRTLLGIEPSRILAFASSIFRLREREFRFQRFAEQLYYLVAATGSKYGAQLRLNCRHASQAGGLWCVEAEQSGSS